MNFKLLMRVKCTDQTGQAKPSSDTQLTNNMPQVNTQ